MTVLLHHRAGSRPLRTALRADVHLVLLDAVMVALAYTLSLVLRFDGLVPTSHWEDFPLFLALAVTVHLALHVSAGLYGRVWLQAGPGEAWQLLVASLTATGVLICVVLATGPVRVVPLSVPLNGGALALLLVGGLRFHSRVLASRAARRTASRLGVGTRVVLVGPVAAVRAVLAQMLADPGAGLVPVVVVTEDRQAWGRSLSGVPVYGPTAALGPASQAHVAEQALLVPGPDGVDAGHVMRLAREAGLRARVLPSLRQPADRPRLRDIRDLFVEDLLGREPVVLDDAAVRQTIQGRRVLVTGAGGSIGREIAAQVAQLQPAELVLLDHDETHLHEAVAMLGRAPSTSVLGDIRDAALVDRLFARYRPEVVCHAAAHKHVPILEDFPSEAVRTNVHGTDVLLTTAVRYGTASFVAISTDKAVDPSSVMGASKRLAEQLTLRRCRPGMRYCAVRFGNVLGSRGSVVPTFLRQVQQGGPVTVTHPDMTRFFMTTREAVHLVLQAASQCRGGEIYLLDMGTPVRIVDLARRIIVLSGETPDASVEILFTGLRPGEKLNEQLHSGVESTAATSHPKILRVQGPKMPDELLLPGLDRLVELAHEQDEPATRRLLFELATLPGQVGLDGELVSQLRRHAGDLRQQTGASNR